MLFKDLSTKNLMFQYVLKLKYYFYPLKELINKEPLFNRIDYIHKKVHRNQMVWLLFFTIHLI